MTYCEIFEGNRKGSLVYRNGTNIYIKDKDTNGVRYLRCDMFKDGRPARAKFIWNQIIFQYYKNMIITNLEKEKLK